MVALIEFNATGMDGRTKLRIVQDLKADVLRLLGLMEIKILIERGQIVVQDDLGLAQRMAAVITQHLGTNVAVSTMDHPPASVGEPVMVAAPEPYLMADGQPDLKKALEELLMTVGFLAPNEMSKVPTGIEAQRRVAQKEMARAYRTLGFDLKTIKEYGL